MLMTKEDKVNWLKSLIEREEGHVRFLKSLLKLPCTEDEIKMYEWDIEDTSRHIIKLRRRLHEEINRVTTVEQAMERINSGKFIYHLRADAYGYVFELAPVDRNGQAEFYSITKEVFEGIKAQIEA